MTDRDAPAGGALSHVVVVGAGLIGTSIGLALRRHGVRVSLQDTRRDRVAAAVGRGAGDPALPGDQADLCVLAVPPSVTASTLRTCQDAHLAHHYTDTASIKAAPLHQAVTLGCDLGTFVGGHPMAGAERPGPAAARGDLFDGRPWVLTPTASSPASLRAVRAMLLLCGATEVTGTPDGHDAAVALVSHAPQVMASLLAGALTDADDLALDVAGLGLRDTTRIAASPGEMWLDILEGNARAVHDVLRPVRAELDRVLTALAALSAHAADPAPARRQISDVLDRGRRGQARLPGKHGHRDRLTTVAVVLDDRPGQLGALFGTLGQAGINVEDVTIDHAQGQPQGLAHLVLESGVAPAAVDRLAERGWSVRPSE